MSNKQKTSKNKPGKVSKRLRKQLKRETQKLRRVISRQSFADFGAKGVDKALKQDLERMLHSYLDADHGYYRGTAQGYSETAIGTSTITQEFTVTAGTYMNWALSPGSVATANWFVYSLGAGAVQNPYTVATTNGTITSPYANGSYMNTPGTEARCVGCELIVVPVSAPLAQSGSSFIAYVPELYKAAAASANLNFAVGENTYNQFKMQLRTNGTRSVIANWVPGDDETDLIANADNISSISGLVGYFHNVGASDIVLQFRFRAAYEFSPTPTIRNIVQVARPNTSLLVWPKFDEFVAMHWDKCLLNELSSYNMWKQSLGLEPSVGVTQIREKPFSMGSPQVNFPGGVLGGLEEVKEEEYVPLYAGPRPGGAYIPRDRPRYDKVIYE